MRFSSVTDDSTKWPCDREHFMFNFPERDAGELQGVGRVFIRDFSAKCKEVYELKKNALGKICITD